MSRVFTFQKGPGGATGVIMVTQDLQFLGLILILGIKRIPYIVISNSGSTGLAFQG